MTSQKNIGFVANEINLEMFGCFEIQNRTELGNNNFPVETIVVSRKKTRREKGN